MRVVERSVSYEAGIFQHFHVAKPPSDVLEYGRSSHAAQRGRWAATKNPEVSW